MKDNQEKNPLHLKSLNHISILCRSVEESISFYQHVLGFINIKRPAAEPEKLPKKTEINPKDNHISFQCESMGAVEKKLKEMGIKHVRARVEEGGIYVDQLFFHDPDGFMIEICNCDNLPVIPLNRDNQMVRTCSRLNFELLPQQQQQAGTPVVQQ
ncbi:Metallothiol transferase FosB [Bienertia sinuspersici]